MTEWSRPFRITELEPAGVRQEGQQWYLDFARRVRNISIDLNMARDIKVHEVAAESCENEALAEQVMLVWAKRLDELRKSSR